MSTIQQAARRMRTFPDRLRRNIIQAEATSAQDALRSAQRWSLGAITSAQLAAAGHPYRLPMSLNGGPTVAPSQDPAIINKQTGLFASSWVTQGPSSVIGGDLLRTQVVNLAPYSGFMRGTAKMIPRPLVERVESEVAGRRLTRLQRAIERAWSR